VAGSSVHGCLSFLISVLFKIITPHPIYIATCFIYFIEGLLKAKTFHLATFHMIFDDFRLKVEFFAVPIIKSLGLSFQ
jgi:hypothetical protein